jgi:hypothetical protein
VIALLGITCYNVGMSYNNHNLSNHPLYRTWVGMRSRCNDPNRPEYKNYGERGIKVCKRWNNFANFLADMGEKPTPEHTIDRKNNDGNYEPSNCHWVTRTEQILNRRMNRNNTSGTVGVSWDKWSGKWMAFTKVNYKMKNLGRYSTLQEAIDARNRYDRMST